MIEGFELYSPMAWVNGGLITAAPAAARLPNTTIHRRHQLLNASLAVSAAALSINVSAQDVALPDVTNVSNPATYRLEVDQETAAENHGRSSASNSHISDTRTINNAFISLFDAMRTGTPFPGNDNLTSLASSAIQRQAVVLAEGPAQIREWANRLAQDVRDADD